MCIPPKAAWVRSAFLSYYRPTFLYGYIFGSDFFPFFSIKIPDGVIYSAGRQDEIIMIVGIGVAIAIGLCILIKWCCQKCYESRSRNQEASLPEVEDREPAVPPVPIRQPSPWVSPPRQEDRRVSTSSTGRPSAPLIPQQQQELPPPPPYTGPPPPYTAPTTTYPNYYQPDVYPGR